MILWFPVQVSLHVRMYVTGVLCTDDTGLLREHTHIGTALGYDFKVVFVTREDKVCVSP